MDNQVNRKKEVFVPSNKQKKEEPKVVRKEKK
jgi:hypothetical protein